MALSEWNSQPQRSRQHDTVYLPTQARSGTSYQCSVLSHVHKINVPHHQKSQLFPVNGERVVQEQIDVQWS